MVSKDVPENSVVVGNPMRIISSYNEYIEKCRIKMRKDNCFDTYFTKKTKKEKANEFDVLYKYRNVCIGVIYNSFFVFWRRRAC